MHRTVLLELIDDCVFSETAATEGAHATLDRIPGSALLGAAAARLYRELSVQDAFAVFHSGRMRFGDGLPEAAPGEPAWPMPLCWHRSKTGNIFAASGRALDAKQIFNFLYCNAIRIGDRQEQAKQIRDGYIARDGRWIRPQRRYRLKTAIDPSTARAAEAQLFGYAALQRGQRFIATIEADEDFDPALFEQVATAFTAPVLLGRSRSAEYGRASATLLECGVSPVTHRESIPTRSGQLTLWLISDLACCDEYGEPSGELDVRGLGMPEGTRILWGKTFLRTRSYSPWNAARHGFDVERRVFTAGGIISLQLPAGADAAAIAARVHRRGIGLHREAGLGRVWVDAPLLAATSEFPHPTFDTLRPEELLQRPDCNHPLIEWLKAQDSGTALAIERRVREIAAKYWGVIGAARSTFGYPSNAHDFYPSRSQWGTVFEAARSSDGWEALRKTLFQSEGALIKADGKGWSLEIPAARSGTEQTLAKWLQDQLDPVEDQSLDRVALTEHLAHTLMSAPPALTELTDDGRTGPGCWTTHSACRARRARSEDSTVDRHRQSGQRIRHGIGTRCEQSPGDSGHESRRCPARTVASSVWRKRNGSTVRLPERQLRFCLPNSNRVGLPAQQ